MLKIRFIEEAPNPILTKRMRNRKVSVQFWFIVRRTIVTVPVMNSGGGLTSKIIPSLLLPPHKIFHIPFHPHSTPAYKLIIFSTTTYLSIAVIWRINRCVEFHSLLLFVPWDNSLANFIHRETTSKIESYAARSRHGDDIYEIIILTVRCNTYMVGEAVRALITVGFALW